MEVRKSEGAEEQERESGGKRKSGGEKKRRTEGVERKECGVGELKGKGIITLTCLVLFER